MEKEYRDFKSFIKIPGGEEGQRCFYTLRIDSFGCGCNHNCSYCLDGETLILMGDNTTKKIKDLKIGDDIYGVVKDGIYYKYTKAKVLNHWKTFKPSYKITLNNGVELICSADHRWLTERGWKYTIGEMTGEDRRPYITTNNKMLGFGSVIDTSMYQETDMYKLGYLNGVIRGDGTMGIYNYDEEGKRKKGNQYFFRLTVKDENIVRRTKEYLDYFGISTNDFKFPMIDRKTKESIERDAIRTKSKENYKSIKEIVSNDKEFLRGFIAGIYDAEGSGDTYIKIFNSDEEILALIKKGLTEFGFDYTYDKPKAIKNTVVKTIRIVGGTTVNLKFAQIYHPSAIDKFSFEGITVKNFDDLGIKSIEPYKEGQELYDITTSTENFIANGVISHNCYGKSLLDFRKLWKPEDPSVTDMKKVEKIFLDVFEKDKKTKWSDILSKRIPVRLGGMTDPMQDIEAETEATYKLLQILKKYNYPYLLLTKNARIGEEKYIEVLDKDLAYVQITITTLNPELSKKVEQNASLPEERLNAIKRLSDSGIYVAGRLSPLFPMYADGHFTKGVESKKLDYFSWELPEEMCKHGAKTVVAEFLRLTPFVHNFLNHDLGDDLKWVLNENSISRGGAKHFSTEEKKYYFDEVKKICDRYGVDFTICDDGDFEAFKYLWANQNDCCNGLGKIPGYTKTMKDIIK